MRKLSDAEKEFHRESADLLRRVHAGDKTLSAEEEERAMACEDKIAKAIDFLETLGYKCVYGEEGRAKNDSR